MGQGVFLRALEPESEKFVRDCYTAALFKCIKDSPIKSFTMCNPNANDSNTIFQEALKEMEATYFEGTKVSFKQEDILQVACEQSLHGKTSYLNPADSVGIYGQWWQIANGGAVEEEFAKITLGLLSQHFKLNPFIEFGKFDIMATEYSEDSTA